MGTSAGAENAGASRTARPRVRLGTPHDAAAAARLHTSRIPTGFLSLLGPRLLTRLYRRVTRSDDSFLLVAGDEGEAVGFLAGSMDTAALMRRFLVIDGPVLALTTGWALLRHWRRTLETLRDARPSRPRAEAKTPEPVAQVVQAEAELLAVAVEEDRRGSGLGSALTRAFLAEAARRGAGSARVVVGATNHGAVKVYERCGFTIAEQFEHHRGTDSLLMRCQLGGLGTTDRSGPAVSE